MYIYILALVIIVGALLFLKYGRKPTAPVRSVSFIIGDINAGKTALLYYLVNKNMNYQTVNSMEPNEATLERDGRQQQVVDIPGHSYAKEQFLGRLAEAKNLVFLVDATNIASIPIIADYLYNILISTTFQQNRPPVLVALNKMDSPNAFKTADFDLFLSREVEKIKKSRKAIHEQREGVNDSLKYDESSFSLDNYKNIRVCEISIKNQQVQEIEDFLFK